MSEHLPECAPRISNWGEDCICKYLRACEQRVLDALREAVARVPDWDGFDGVTGTYRATDKDMALAAIDALREEP